MAIESSRDPAAFQDFEHTSWEAASDGYERHLYASYLSNCPRHSGCGLCCQGNSSLLDVCTGPGLLAAAALERKEAVFSDSTSSSKVMIAVARRNVPWCRVPTW